VSNRTHFYVPLWMKSTFAGQRVSRRLGMHRRRRRALLPPDMNAELNDATPGQRQAILAAKVQRHFQRQRREAQP